MFRRKLYSTWDRLLFWIGITETLLGWSIVTLVYRMQGFLSWEDVIIGGCVGPLTIVLVYVGRKKPADGAQDQYSTVIADIESIGRQLNALAEFLKRERAKVEESEAALKHLREERIQLEPVVMTHRETVNAILAVHAKTTASHTWKERVLGFISGALASLLASMVYEFLRRS